MFESKAAPFLFAFLILALLLVAMFAIGVPRKPAELSDDATVKQAMRFLKKQKKRKNKDVEIDEKQLLQQARLTVYGEDVTQWLEAIERGDLSRFNVPELESGTFGVITRELTVVQKEKARVRVLNNETNGEFFLNGKFRHKVGEVFKPEGVWFFKRYYSPQRGRHPVYSIYQKVHEQDIQMAVDNRNQRD